MNLKMFESGDVYRNTLEAFPKFEFRLQNGKIYLNGGNGYITPSSILVEINPETPGVLDFSSGKNSYNISNI